MLKDFKEMEYYSRILVLKGIGKEGLSKLRDKRVAIIGLGGLGNVIAYLLASNGCGYLRLIDQDIIELSNLARQPLFTTEDIGKPKVEVAAERLKKINPNVEIEAYAENLNLSNYREYLQDVDIILDGLDNLATRDIINSYAVEKGIPYVFGSVLRYEGSVSFFKPRETPCLRCIIGDLQDEGLETCETAGVLNTAVNIIASIEANEALKYLLGIKPSLFSKMMLVDVKSLIFDIIEVRRREDCPVCSGKFAYKPADIGLIWSCGKNLVNVNPRRKIDLNLNNIKDEISEKIQIKIKSPIMLGFVYKDKEISLFKNGRMLIKNVSNNEEAIQLYNEIIEMIT